MTVHINRLEKKVCEVKFWLKKVFIEGNKKVNFAVRFSFRFFCLFVLTKKSESV